MTTGYRSDMSWAPMPEPVTDDQYAAARRAVDRNAANDTEAALFLSQLGIEVA